MVWYSHLLKNFPQLVVIYTVKGFGIISKAEVDILLEFSCLFVCLFVFCMIQWMLAIFFSGSSAFSKSTLNIWMSMVHVLLTWLGEFCALLC